MTRLDQRQAPGGVDIESEPRSMKSRVAEDPRFLAARPGRAGAAFWRILVASAALLGIAHGAAAQTTTVTGTLVQVIDTSTFTPPSPDPAGITFLPSTTTLLVSDSEVNEMAIFAGVNLFEVTLPGVKIGDGSTTAFSNEPTGLSFDPATQRLFVSDDDANAVFVVESGPDGFFGTGDDLTTEIDAQAFGSDDAEGVAFDTLRGDLYVLDGAQSELFVLSPGTNGVFDGVPPTGDDTATSFPVGNFGAADPEGVTYDEVSDTLLVVDRTTRAVYQTTPTGTLLRVIDVSAVGSGARLSGIALAPASSDPGTDHLYITDRRVDNGGDPNENDGKIYEIAVAPLTGGNAPPLVQAGSDLIVDVGGFAVLDGSVSDDGMPDPPGQVVSTWSQEDGPGAVTFADAAAPQTTATFSTAGTYRLRLGASDGEFNTSDDVTVVVTGSNGEVVLERRVATGSDDAEERASGNVSLGSSDLELVFDGGGNQVVGLRFASLGIPQGAVVQHAYVQFHADESHSGPTTLTLEGEATADSAPFVNASGNVSARPRTTAGVSWSPSAWVTGEATLKQRTPDLSGIIQEIVGGPSWSSGNSLTILVSGSGERTAEAFESGSSTAPLLHVEYFGDAPPTASISAPADGSVFTEGTTVQFSGSASDAEDGDLTASLSWSSDLDGALGTGGAASATLTVGTHTITAAVVDSDGLGGSDAITVTITPPANTPPTATIVNPADGSVFTEGDTIQFSGSADDAEDGDLTGSLAWNSDRDGHLGTGGSIAVSTLRRGRHTITATVTDSGGTSTSAAIRVRIRRDRN